MSCVLARKACLCPPACPPFLPPPPYHVEITRWEHVGVAQQIAADAVSCRHRKASQVNAGGVPAGGALAGAAAPMSRSTCK
jgi:hypothetical protein